MSFLTTSIHRVSKVAVTSAKPLTKHKEVLVRDIVLLQRMEKLMKLLYFLIRMN